MTTERTETVTMSVLFEPTEINSMKLSNRFVRSATWAGLATEEGGCTPKLVGLMRRLAQGGVGLIITGHAYVRRDGQAGPWQLGIYKDNLVPGLREMTRAVHETGCRIVLQIAHAGAYAQVGHTGEIPVAVSHVDGLLEDPCDVLSVEGIRGLAEAFGEGARRAREAGFDGVQIHAAHGYLLSQFLSPLYNKRADAYGGAVDNRARALLDVFQSMRASVGKDFPILIKMNCQDFVEGGLTLSESIEVGELLQHAGLDAIEVSGGVPKSRKLGSVRVKIDSEDKEAYFREEAKAFKARLHVPLILVGGIRSFHVAERLVEQGYTDYIAMSRPFIREPDLVKRWASGDMTKSTCISDTRCLAAGRTGEGIYCVVEAREQSDGKDNP
jgi:2,4-dienoyl-CoA reductase-like NADH-dependent reductase (Old Yellow Enzyme family)